MIVGTSALSVTLYEGGRTAHNLFRIPVIEVCSHDDYHTFYSMLCLAFQNNIALKSSIQPFSPRAALISSAAVIVWEEFASSNVVVAECAHEICCLITNCHAPFGRIPFITVGDFQQVAPVVQGQGKTPTILASVKRSHLWPHFIPLALHFSYRGASDPEYTSFVDSVGEDYTHEKVPLDILDTVTNINEAINFLFPSDILRNPLLCLKRAFLSPKNKDVDDFNNCILDRLEGEECTYLFSLE